VATVFATGFFEGAALGGCEAGFPLAADFGEDVVHLLLQLPLLAAGAAAAAGIAIVIAAMHAVFRPAERP
jgi:hypothetical protein